MMATMALSTAAFAQNRVTNLYASASKLDMEKLQDSSQAVRLNRFFLAGYNTLCLPFSLTADQVAAAATGLKLERFAGIRQEGETLDLYFVDCTAEGIQAGLPYLVYSPTSQYMRVLYTEAADFDAELQSVCMMDGIGNVVTFGSSWESIQKVGRYGIPAKQDVTPLESVLVETDAEKTFLPTRCGFNWDEKAQTAKELRIRHANSMGEVTAVTGITQESNTEGDYYNLQGQRVTKDAKGIRVQEGKKSIVK